MRFVNMFSGFVLLVSLVWGIIAIGYGKVGAEGTLFEDVFIASATDMMLAFILLIIALPFALYLLYALRKANQRLSQG